MSAVKWAAEMAENLLAEGRPRRWAHVQVVARRAGELATALGPEGDVLRAAAWLHDVGYAPQLVNLSFHPLDGARHIRSEGGSERLAGLVAYHSAAAIEADYLGLAHQLAEFDDERTLVRDLLWLADMTVGPSGELMTFKERMEEVRERYPADHYVSRALDASMPEREAAVARAERWIADHVK